MIDNFDLTFRGRKFGISFELPLNAYGGPFREIMNLEDLQSSDMLVCLKEEATREEKNHCDRLIPIRDFSIPKKEDRERVFYIVRDALNAMVGGDTVYAGCMGGTGRTGLFYALVAEAAGHENPVAYVRKNYRSHAVETKEQEHYVTGFIGLKEIHDDMNTLAFWSWVKSKKKGLLNRVFGRFR